MLRDPIPAIYLHIDIFIGKQELIFVSAYLSIYVKCIFFWKEKINSDIAEFVLDARLDRDKYESCSNTSSYVLDTAAYTCYTIFTSCFATYFAFLIILKEAGI